MSLLDTASLIVTPNGYKEGKLYSVIPSDGSGDLSVTRATTATRVNSAGLVELVPYNLLQYSEQLSNGASWGFEQISVTSNSTTAPNGTLTADTITDNSTFGYLYQTSASVSASQIVTHSVFLKRSNNDWVNVATSRTPGTTYGEFGVWFNLATGAIGSNFQAGAGVLLDSEITDEGNGWYRCSITGYVTNAVGYVPYVFNSNADNSFTSSVGKSVYAWGAQLNEGTLKDYQKTETRLNIPRLDYSNGTCPSILVEPQRTNLFLYSSSFDNASWGKDTSVTITANYSTSPSGIQDADRFQKNATSGVEGITQNQFGLSSGAKAFSVYLKSNTGSNQSAFLLYANFQTQAITITSEWQRFDIVFNAITTVDYLGIVATSALDILVWGAQLEAGSYATSYIPTTSASVTRNADAIYKTGISSLIGQTEGVIFTDFVCNGFQNYGTPISINDGTTSNYIWLTIFANGNIRVEVYSGSVQASITYTGGVVGQRYKVAFAYKQNDFVMYVNGVQIGADSSGNVPLNLSRMDYNLANTWSLALLNINASALWKTRLTNAQLATLTTI